jgi:hypothetical protein
VTPFCKPGVSATIPDRAEEQTCVRFLQVSTILRDLKMLEQPLRDIEDDRDFIANAMDSALQVPKAINLTFNRIHGRIYDIQRDIEYSSNNLDAVAIKIQKNFRAFRERRHYRVIREAMHNTIRRDCGPIHECLLGFLLSYAKGDDDFRMLLNRRFLVRGRNALKYWRQWCVESREANARRKVEIKKLRHRWLQRRSLTFLREWKALAFSRHSRKALRDLHTRITAEAQRRLADNPSPDSSLSLLEQLAIERENVIVDFGRRNSDQHLTHTVLVFWRLYVEQCKRESRSGNAIAREFWMRRKKQSFFNAWFSLSVGRVVVFGGWARWRRPENRWRTGYEQRVLMYRQVVRAWRWLVVRKQRMLSFQRQRNNAFLVLCIREFHNAVASRRARLSRMMETYVSVLRGRLHKVFQAWSYHVKIARVRKRPVAFILQRAQLMRKFRVIRRSYVRWTVRWIQRQTQRHRLEAKDIDNYTTSWAEAGAQMRESMLLISELNEKLSSELQRRNADLSSSSGTVAFLRDEQKSLVYAMMNLKREIEDMHAIIARSTMRYYVDTKPIHGHVVADVPGALASYIAQKEQEKARMMAQKQAQQQMIVAPAKPTKAPSAQPMPKRRKTLYPGHAKGKASGKVSKARNSLMGAKLEPIDEDKQQEEE